MASVFISYSRVDREFVRQLREALILIKRDVWIDWHDIPPTSKWREEIFNAIEKADHFVFILSPDSLASAMCRDEITHAAQNNKRPMPILLRMVHARQLPTYLAEIQWVDFSSPDRFNVSLKILIQSLDVDLAWVQKHTDLQERALEWDRKGHDAGFLLRRKALREAEEWLAETGDRKQKPTSLHTRYIIASRKAETAFERRVLLAATVALTVAVVLALVAFAQRRNAQRQTRIAFSRELAVAATSNLDIDPERSVLLALYAISATYPLDRAATLEAEDTLHQAVQASRVRTVFSGHADQVRAISFHPSGHSLATASFDGTAKVWDATSGRELLTLSGHKGEVTGVAFSPDGRRLATANRDGTAKVWDATSGRELLTLSGHKGEVTGVAFSPDGRRLATSSMDKTAKLWDTVSGKQLLTLHHTEGVLGIDFSSRGQRLATATVYAAKLWDLSTGKELLTFSGHHGSVHRVVFSPDGLRLATASTDGTAKVWNASSGKEQH